MQSTLAVLLFIINYSVLVFVVGEVAEKARMRVPPLIVLLVAVFGAFFLTAWAMTFISYG